MMASRRGLKFLNEHSFKFIMNIINYIKEKEFVTLNEIWDEMNKQKWASSLIWCDSKARLSAVLRHRLATVIKNDEYILVSGGDTRNKLYSLPDNWGEKVTKLFGTMKKKGEIIGYYEVEK